MTIRSASDWTYPQSILLLYSIELFPSLDAQLFLGLVRSLGFLRVEHPPGPGGVTPGTCLPAVVDVQAERGGAQGEGVSMNKWAGLALLFGLK